MKKKILMTSIGGMFAHDFIRALRETKDIFILGTDINKTSNAYYLDKFEQISDPAKDKNKYIKKIIYLCKKYQINLILPGSDNECIEISKNLKKFYKMNIKTSVSNFKIIRKIIDKHTLFKTLKENKIDVGEWYTINNLKELKKNFKNNGLSKKKINN